VNHHAKYLSERSCCWKVPVWTHTHTIDWLLYTATGDQKKADNIKLTRINQLFRHPLMQMKTRSGQIKSS